jgi:hypothetical protein
MKNKLAAGLTLLCVFLLIGTSAFAHHGGAAYDRSKVTTLKGKVTDFKFINPHVLLYLDVTDDKGNVAHWACESPDDPAMLERQGWTHSLIKVGDELTVVGFPAKSGTTVMSLQKVILADGRELSNKILD